ncbi:MAG: chromate transporter [Thermodesulfovibrio sp.]|nr:chromate transporter [Thermodesulfovibrio sp.]
MNIFLAFLRLGLTAFGGPAMVANIKQVAVEERKWLDKESFQEGVAIAQTIPGPIAMHVAAYVGLKIRGFRCDCKLCRIWTSCILNYDCSVCAVQRNLLNSRGSLYFYRTSGSCYCNYSQCYS